MHSVPMYLAPFVLMCSAVQCSATEYTVPHYNAVQYCSEHTSYCMFRSRAVLAHMPLSTAMLIRVCWHVQGNEGIQAADVDTATAAAIRGGPRTPQPGGEDVSEWGSDSSVPPEAYSFLGGSTVSAAFGSPFCPLHHAPSVLPLSGAQVCTSLLILTEGHSSAACRQAQLWYHQIG